jgi:hypothetical protein
LGGCGEKLVVINLGERRLTMVTLKTDDTRFLHNLAWCIEPAEVYDKTGKLLGVFVPANLDKIKEKYGQLLAMVERDRHLHRDEKPGECTPHREVIANLTTLNEESERRQQSGEQPFTREEVEAFLRTGNPKGNGGPNTQSKSH